MGLTAYFDCGNTNTRLYLLREDLSLFKQTRIAYGVKEVAMGAGREDWIRTLCGLYRGALAECGLQDGDISEIWASGMATSGFGFQNIPHLSVPVSFEELARQIVPVPDGLFGRDIFLIPGLKTQGTEAEEIHHVRGEETEALGIAARLAVQKGQETAVVLPGSHTQTVFYRDGRFTDLLSTFTGELYAARRFGTSLAGVLPEEDPSEPDPDMFRRGAENARRLGFSRAVYLTLTLGRFEFSDPAGRAAYLQGAILSSFTHALEDCIRQRHPDIGRLVIVGDQKIGRIYQLLLETSRTLPPAEWMASDREDPAALEGLRALVRLRSAL